MEQMISVMGRNYVLTDSKISELIAWLEANAIKYTSPKAVVKEDIKNEGKELLMESKNDRG